MVLFNTGSGLKYTGAIAEAMHLTRPGAKKYPQRTPVGGSSRRSSDPYW